MSTPSCITSDLTVRQVVGAWPACAEVVGEYAAARWGGRWTLQELGAFARACGIDEGALRARLSAVAGVPVGRRARSSRGDSPVAHVFVALLIGITLGAGWGVGLLLRIAYGADYAAVPGASVHAHGVAQLWGWVALFVFAIGAHLLRQNSKRPAPVLLEYVTSACVAIGLLAFAADLLLPRGIAAIRFDVIGAVFLAAAATSFAASAVASLAGRGQKPLLWHYFVLALLGWLLIWAGMNVFLRLAHGGASVLPDAARNLLIVLPVLGFATNAIYGFGIRLIPGLMNIGRLRPACFVATLAMHNAGVALLLLPHRGFGIAGAALMIAACAAYLIGMNGLRGKPSRPIYGVDTRSNVLIRVAFFWLAAGLIMLLGEQVVPGLSHAYSGAWRHALTVGFITTMMLGVGHRIVPIQMRQPLASPRLMLLTAALLIVGNAGRVGLELVTIGEYAWAYRLMGVTGILELSALLLFAANLALTWRDRRRTYRDGMPLAPATRVREAINVYPQIQQRLHEMGITMLDQAPFVAPSMTFGAMALAWGRQPEQLLAELCATPLVSSPPPPTTTPSDIAPEQRPCAAASR